MNTYQQIISLERTLFEDFKSPSNNSTFKEALKSTIESLKRLHSFY